MKNGKEVWSLTTLISGGEVRVYGDHARLNEALESYEGQDFEEDRRIRIVGACGPTDSCEKVVVVNRSQIQGMVLLREF